MIARHLWVSAVVFSLVGCAVSSRGPEEPDPIHDPVHIAQLSRLLPADAILLGEQHDAPDHQRIHRLMVETLAARQTLAALALEMASQGQSTEKLGPTAGEDQVRAALQWDNAAWPWTAYGPVVMAAVRAGVPVVGANLPPARWREAMTDTGFDRLLSGPALKAQQQNIRLGHCGLLPESQISPMTRIQIARDVSMAQTVTRAALAGKTVLLLAGSGHVDRILGIPQHLPPGFKVKTVLLHAEQASVATNSVAQFDHFWPARPAPVIDYCANLTARQLTQPF
ncbi:MAG: ChaN family lipoprotein [Rhodoferax sp.]|uniref:ChaN family lipoprotein n=1 Tax=Rhodoferax sp. TaxID=50421 RepID=UPI002727090D|nr:ChaN family lipoprotein [Rhodoferax sp.]MDO8450453.1 ChaN family lipoprotein [Rhodoferax sp.]